MEKRSSRKVVAISMPQSLFDETVERLRVNRYGSMSEYIRDLIRKDEWAEWLVKYKNDPAERKRSMTLPHTHGIIVIFDNFTDRLDRSV